VATLTMYDGPPANLPNGADAYAGYVNRSGIGITWPQVSELPATWHLSITTDGSSAMCADVESGAMTSWKGYTVGYCSVANVNSMVAKYGRPTKLWTAHTGAGEHICGPKTCNYGGNLVTAADGTQWNSPGPYDQSILLDNFFSFLTPNPSPAPGDYDMLAPTPTGNGYWTLSAQGAIITHGDAQYFGGPNTSFVNGKWNGPPNLIAGHTCVTITAHPAQQGYWIEDNTGNVYAYGAAKFLQPN